MNNKRDNKKLSKNKTLKENDFAELEMIGRFEEPAELEEILDGEHNNFIADEFDSSLLEDVTSEFVDPKPNPFEDDFCSDFSIGTTNESNTAERVSYTTTKEGTLVEFQYDVFEEKYHELKRTGCDLFLISPHEFRFRKKNSSQEIETWVSYYPYLKDELFES